MIATGHVPNDDHQGNSKLANSPFVPSSWSFFVDVSWLTNFMFPAAKYLAALLQFYAKNSIHR